MIPFIVATETMKILGLNLIKITIQGKLQNIIYFV